jgi:hypothetical protein
MIAVNEDCVLTRCRGQGRQHQVQTHPGRRTPTLAPATSYTHTRLRLFVAELLLMVQRSQCQVTSLKVCATSPNWIH